MLVRSDQSEVCPVKVANLLFGNGSNGECKKNFACVPDGVKLSRYLSRMQERESHAELVMKGRAVGEPQVWCPMTGPSGLQAPIGHIRRCCTLFRQDEWRGFVARTQVHARDHEFLVGMK